MKGKNVKIEKLGKGNGILLSKTLLDMFSLKVGDDLSVKIQDEKIILSPVKKEQKSLVERFSNYSNVTKQKELWNDNPIGKEKI